VLGGRLRLVSDEWVLRRQFGVISRRQARAGGMSEDQIDRRLASSRWLTVRPGVYLAADRDLTDEARILAVGLWAGDGGTITGLAAARWHRLWPDPPPVAAGIAAWTRRPGPTR
jgi:hypothetical protein